MTNGADGCTVGTLFKIKPIPILKDGVIEPPEQVRARQKALTRILDLVEEHLGEGGPQARVAVAQALVPEEAGRIAPELQARPGCPPPVMAEIGPVIGTHAGPGVIGVATCA